MDRSFCILPAEDIDTQHAWRALWEKSPQRSPFSQLSYARAVSDALDFSFSVIGLFSDPDRDELLAGAILFERQRGLYREVVIPPFTQYSPVLFAGQIEDTLIHARASSFDLLLETLENRYGKVALHLHPTLRDVRTMNWAGWNTKPLYTYTLELNNEEQLLADWSSSTRRTFRKSRSDYHIEESPVSASDIVNLCSSSYARHGRSFPVKDTAAVKMIDRMQQEGCARLFTATDHRSEKIEAGLAVLHDGETAYYWIAGSQPGNAMTVLLGTVLPMLYRDGLRRFDFVGANTPTIAEFKRRFGSQLVPYYRVEKVMHPALRLLFRFIGIP